MRIYRINLDNSDENADWIKSACWDLRVPVTQKLVETLAELFAYLGVAEADMETQAGHLDQFLELPAARAMPASLRDEIEQWAEDVEDAQARGVDLGTPGSVE